MLKSKFWAGAAFATALAAFAPAAQASTYSTSGASLLSIGDNIGSLYDQLFLTAASGTITAPGTYTLNSVEFAAGANSNYNEVVPGSISQQLTIDGVSQTLTIPFSLDVNAADTMTIFSGAALTFAGWQVVLNSLTIGPNGGGSLFGILTAEISETQSFAAEALAVAETPLPAALPLFAGGLGVIGVVAHRRKRKAIAA